MRRMRGVLFFGALGAVGALAQGCVENGSGIAAEETVRLDMTGVERVSVCCGFEVHVARGGLESGVGGLGGAGAEEDEVTVSADDNLIDHVLVRVVDQTLELGWRDGNVWHDTALPVVIELALPRLTRLDASGGSRVELGAFEAADIAISQSGGGHVQFESVLASTLTVDMSGGGRFEVPDMEVIALSLTSSGGGVAVLGGSCSELSADSSGGGQILAFELETKDAHLALSGGGIAELNVTGSLTGGASGGSRVSVIGGAEVSLDLSGGSTVSED